MHVEEVLPPLHQPHAHGEEARDKRLREGYEKDAWLGHIRAGNRFCDQRAAVGGGGCCHWTCHLCVYEVMSDSAAHVAVADEEDVGVEGLQDCSRDVKGYVV